MRNHTRREFLKNPKEPYMDLLGRRAEAVAHYKAALKRGKGLNTQHDQYGMTINRR